MIFKYQCQSVQPVFESFLLKHHPQLVDLRLLHFRCESRMAILRGRRDDWEVVVVVCRIELGLMPLCWMSVRHRSCREYERRVG